MRDEDVFFSSKSVFELEIALLAYRIVLYFGIRTSRRRGALQSFASVGIDAHTVVLSYGTIERDAGLGAGADVVHIDVVKEEGANGVRLPYNTKFTLHSSWGFVRL